MAFSYFTYRLERENISFSVRMENSLLNYNYLLLSVTGNILVSLNKMTSCLTAIVVGHDQLLEV